MYVISKNYLEKTQKRLANYFLINVLGMSESIEYNPETRSAISISINKHDDCNIYYQKNNETQEEILTGFISYRDLTFRMETEIMFMAAINMDIAFKLILKLLDFFDRFNSYNLVVCIHNVDELIELYEKAGFFKDYIREKRYRNDKPVVIMRKIKWDVTEENM